MDILNDLLRTFDPEHPHFPPTLIYNEGWLLRLVLHWFSQNPGISDHPVRFQQDSDWFSEALLPSAFKPRYSGDPLGEGRTHADGAVGHIVVGKEGKADLALKDNGDQLVVVEAKLQGKLSRGITHAEDYDQAARTVACMAEVLKKAKQPPENMSKLGFYVLAPAERIAEGIFEEEMDKDSIRKKVRKRVRQYEGCRDNWFDNWFKPLWKRIEVDSTSWGNTIDTIGETDVEAANTIDEFYKLCEVFGK